MTKIEAAFKAAKEQVEITNKMGSEQSAHQNNQRAERRA